MREAFLAYNVVDDEGERDEALIFSMDDDWLTDMDDIV
jgi:hypothetical protein